MSASKKLIQAAGNAAGEGLYVEEVFSTYLYDGNGSTQTITNGIDLDGEGGLVWIKRRSSTENHNLHDTERGTGNLLISNSTNAELTGYSDMVTSFNSNGFSVGNNGYVNQNGQTYTSWTFRKASKFFDVVTYTGTGSPQNISHNLGSVPGCIIVKCTSTTAAWAVWHRSSSASPNDDYLRLDATDAVADAGVSYWNNTSPTSTQFTVNSSSDTNFSGRTYVAYLFAHNDGDGEFGENADQDIIKCGSYTGTGSAGNFIDLGFEPQWVMIKNSSATGNWWLLDVMRGASATSSAYMFADTTAAEASSGSIVEPKATGFNINNTGSGTNTNGATYIYIAIRRGLMKTPEAATEVFAPVSWTGDNTEGRNIPTGFPVDLTVEQVRTVTGSTPQENLWFDRLRGYSSTASGSSYYLRSQLTQAETPIAGYNYVPTMDGFNFGGVATGVGQFNGIGVTAVAWNFRRAPGFFDVVAYEGNGTAGHTVSHNLGVVPEIIIVKRRNAAFNWFVYASGVGNTAALSLNQTIPASTSTTYWNDTDPTESNFSLGTFSQVNGSGGDYIAYLFATVPGVSKVGSYTGNGSSQTIDCGFSAGARFVLIKRTDSTGDWHVYDSERGIVAGNDPRLELNTTDAEDTGSDDIDPVSSGFSVTSNADVNTNTAEYIFLAIA